VNLTKAILLNKLH